MTFIGGFLLTLAAHVGIGLAALGVVRSIRTGDRRLDVLWWWIVKWTLMSAGAICLGAFGWLKAWPMLAFAAAAGAGGALLLRGHDGEVMRWPGEIRDGVRAWWAGAAPDARALASALVVFAFLFGIRLALAVWFTAPYGGDETWYHLPKLAQWIQSGTLDRPALPDLRSSFPGGMQLLQAWWVVFLHHDVVIEMASVEVLAFGIAAVYALCRVSGFAAAPATMTALLFSAVPVIATQASACTNDLMIGAMTLAILAFALREGPRVRDAGFLLCIVLLGLSVKPTVVYVLPAAIALMWVRPRGQGMTAAGIDGARLSLLGVAAMVGAYWYLRNAAEYGNPLYPAGVSLFGWVPFNEAPGVVLLPGDESRQQTWVALDALRINANEFANSRMHDAFVPFNHAAWRQMGWGWFGMGLGLPMMVLALRDRRIHPRLALAGLATVVLTFAVLLPDLWTMRFVAWASVFPCMAIAAVIGSLDTIPRRVIGYLLCIGLGLNLLGVMFMDGITPRHLRETLARSWETRSGGDFMNSQDRSEAALESPLVFAGTGYPAYTLYGPELDRRVVPIRFGSVGELEETLRASGARFLVAGNLDRAARFALRSAVERGLLAPIDARVYRVTP